jgi:group I intron endonuclease
LEVVPEVELGTELEILLDTCGIYTITHRESGRCYVGQALNMHKRWLSHQSSLRRNKHDSKYMQNVWNKYFEDAFDFEVVENCDVDDLTEREQWWMDELKPVFNTCPTAGSRRGFVCTAETKAKIGAAAMGNTRRLGMKNTDETKAKMSAASKGKPKSAEHRAKMVVGLVKARAAQHPVSPETRAKMSAAQKGRPGRPPTEETRAKMSAAHKGRKQSPETIAARIGRVMSFETRAKIGAAKKGKALTPMHRAAISAGRARAKAERNLAKQEIVA